MSPDGKLVAYSGYDWTDDTYITNRLYVMNADGSNPREIAVGLDRTPEGVTWARDGSGVYFSAQSEGRSDFYFAPLSGSARKLTTGDHYLTVASISNTGVAAATRTTATDPGNIVVFDLANPKTPRQLTDINGDLLAGKHLGATEEIWYTSVDGFKIQGWIIKPPDFDPARKYPLMLSIHGGPHGMFALATPYMWFEWQFYAAQGFVVLYTNPRGSSGYGSAFGNAIKNAYPGKDYDDLMAGVDTVLGPGVRRQGQHVRVRLQRWRRAHGVGRRPHQPLRSGVRRSARSPTGCRSSGRPTDRAGIAISPSCPGRIRRSTSGARRSCTSGT